jgi:hypothetical protein
MYCHEEMFQSEFVLLAPNVGICPLSISTGRIILLKPEL